MLFKIAVHAPLYDPLLRPLPCHSVLLLCSPLAADKSPIVHFARNPKKIKDRPSHLLDLENFKTPFHPVVFSNLRRATFICSFPTTILLQTFCFFRDSNRSHSKLLYILSSARRFWALLRSASICVNLPFSVLLLRVRSRHWKKDSLDGNRVLFFCPYNSY